MAVIVLVIAVILMIVLNWLMKRFVDLIDDVKILSAIEKSLATVIFVLFAVAVIAVFIAILYTFSYYNIFDFSQFYTENSPLTSSFFGVMEEWLVPIFEQIGVLLATA